MIMVIIIMSYLDLQNILNFRSAIPLGTNWTIVIEKL
jgi:hypothetical protein